MSNPKAMALYSIAGILGMLASVWIGSYVVHSLAENSWALTPAVFTSVMAFFLSFIVFANAQTEWRDYHE